MAEPTAAVVNAPDLGDWQLVVEGLRGARHEDVQRLQKLIARTVGHYTTALEQRADISQEVVFRVISAARRDLIREPAALPYFARVVARNHAVNWLAGAAARRRREFEVGLAALAEAASSACEGELDLKRALAALPEHVREVVTGLYWHGATYDELALRLGVSVVTIKRRRAQAICALRRRLQG